MINPGGGLNHQSEGDAGHAAVRTSVLVTARAAATGPGAPFDGTAGRTTRTGITSYATLIGFHLYRPLS